MMLELVRKPKATVDDFKKMMEELKEYHYIVQYQIIQVKGYAVNLQIARHISNIDYKPNQT